MKLKRFFSEESAGPNEIEAIAWAIYILAAVVWIYSHAPGPF